MKGDTDHSFVYKVSGKLCMLKMEFFPFIDKSYNT